MCKKPAFFFTLLFGAALFITPSCAYAQRSIRIVIADSINKMALPGANAVLFTKDSSFIKGVASDTAGVALLNLPHRSEYILRVSMIGYQTLYANIPPSRHNGKPTISDTLFLPIKTVYLKDATVIGTRPDMQTVEDTTSFNAEEYKVPEGEALKELIKLLPGVEIEGNTITYNGKPISEFRVNGKDFFKGNVRSALKNLPSELVNKIKAYEKKSDYAEQTGIDDGNEQTVMDIELKKELNEAWTINYDAAAGSYGRYIQKVFANRMTDRSRLSFTANMNDEDARSNNKSLGADFQINNGKTRKENRRLEIGGHMGMHDNRSHGKTWRSAENYIGASQTSQFSNSDRYSKNKSTGFGGNLRMEWHPDTLTTVTANTNFSFNKSRTFSLSRSARFNSDPYEITNGEDPIGSVFGNDFSYEHTPEIYNATINRNSNTSKSNGNNYSFGISAMAVRRLNNKGRNVAFDFRISSGNGESKSFRIADIYYYKRAADKNHTFQNQYTISPSHNWSNHWRVSYSEPIIKGLRFQTSYSFQRSKSRSYRSLYELDSLNGWHNGEHQLGDIPATEDSLQSVLNMQNSRYATYNNFHHTLHESLNYNSRNLTAFISTDISSNTTRLDYRRSAIDTTFSRRLLRFKPSAMLRYRISKNERTEIRYIGWSTDPSMTNRIPISDNADPLNIHLPGGNLKPAWNNRIRFEYKKYIVKRQQNWQVNAQLDQSSNNISTAIIYDETTGVRITQPKNINGNWAARTDFTFNTGFGAKKSFRLNCSTTGTYDNSVGYIRSEQNTSSQKNTTKTSGISQKASLRYRNDFLEAKIGASIRYRHTDNKLRPQSNMDTYNYSYSASARVKLPWKMTVENSLHMSSRRGYSNSNMNTDELIWNATASQSFFKGSPLIVRLKLNDILRNRSNISRTINAQSRVDTENDASYSYLMLHFIIRLNILNGKISSGFFKNDKKNKKEKKDKTPKEKELLQH